MAANSKSMALARLSRILFAGAITSFAAATVPGAEPAPTKAAPAPASAIHTEGPTVELPKFEVSAPRLREIDKKIKRLEKEVSREKKLLERSALDDTLNNDSVSRAAALFGGKSAVQRASVAAVRIGSIEKEISLLETLRTPLTASDRALAEKLVEDQRTYRRELDIALR